MTPTTVADQFRVPPGRQKYRTRKITVVVLIGLLSSICCIHCDPIIREKHPIVALPSKAELR